MAPAARPDQTASAIGVRAVSTQSMRIARHWRAGAGAPRPANPRVAPAVARLAKLPTKTAPPPLLSSLLRTLHGRFRVAQASAWRRPDPKRRPPTCSSAAQGGSLSAPSQASSGGCRWCCPLRWTPRRPCATQGWTAQQPLTTHSREHRPPPPPPPLSSAPPRPQQCVRSAPAAQATAPNTSSPPEAPVHSPKPLHLSARGIALDPLAAGPSLGRSDTPSPWAAPPSALAPGGRCLGRTCSSSSTNPRTAVSRRCWSWPVRSVAC